ncbi:MAG TPA: response regulator transcription factor [Bacteroidales bacterium]|nr:response regulator transcription factor [Bacteroidales bacterium]
MKGKHKIFIVDDHRIFREAISLLIAQMEDYEVIGEASGGLAFLNVLGEVKLDVVLMDICMPGINGIDTSVMALDKNPSLKIIALSMFSDQEHLRRMMEAGALGFILKESGKEELRKALDTVMKGEKYLSPKLFHNIITHASDSADISRFAAKDDISGLKLTDTEAEVLRLICNGFSTFHISEMLSLSVRAVDACKTDLMVKTGSKNPVSLAVFAMKNNLVEV